MSTIIAVWQVARCRTVEQDIASHLTARVARVELQFHVELAIVSNRPKRFDGCRWKAHE